MHTKTIIFVTGALLGVTIGYGTQYASEIVIATILLAFTQAVLLLVERRELRGKSGERKTEGFSLALFTILFSVGIILGVVRVQLVEEKIPFVCESTCTFDAVIVSTPESKDAYQTVVVHPVKESNTTYDVQLRVPLYPQFAVGETLRVSGKVNVPDTIFPHGNQKSFDYASYLHTKDVGSEMVFPKIEILDEEPHTFTASLGRWKESLVARMNQYVASPASTLATGMIFGNSSMSKELVQTFRTAGLSHIIVLSGFNIAIVIAFILFVFAFMPLFIRIALASFFVVGFVMMVGAEASVMRATVMAFISLLSMLVGREYVARQALVLSLFAIVMYEPDALLHSVSLHLSFLATMGIVYLSEPIKLTLTKYFSHMSLIELFSTTLSAYFATLPYIMYAFGTVSVYALVANVVALPFVPVAMLMSSVVVLLSYISSPVALLFGYVDALLINIILFIARVVESLPLSSFMFTLSFVGMCAMYGIGLIFLTYISKRKNDETSHINENGYLTDIIPY